MVFPQLGTVMNEVCQQGKIVYHYDVYFIKHTSRSILPCLEQLLLIISYNILLHVVVYYNYIDGQLVRYSIVTLQR